MIRVRIEHSDGQRHIQASYKDVGEMMEDLPSWLSEFEKDWPLIQTTKRYKADPEGTEKTERESGWYIDLCEKNNLT